MTPASVPVPSAVRSRNLGDVAARAAAADPARVALVDLADAEAPRSWTYGDLHGAAGAVARRLSAGARRGDRVAILGANSAEYYVVFLGAMRAGLVAVPVNWKLSPATIARVLRDSGASLVFADGERRSLVGGDLPVFALDAHLEGALGPGNAATPPGATRVAAAGPPFETILPGADELAMILYTSGSTGVPKGVPLTHHGQLWAIEHRLGTTPGMDRQRLLVAAPFFHMNALCVTAFALAGGASVVLLPRFSARAYVEAIGRHRCTWLTAVPTMMALAARETAALARTDLSSVERVSMGSAPLGQALIDRVRALFPGALMGNGYGTTETGPVAFGAHPRGLPRPDIALGYPADGVDMRLVDGANLDADEGVLHLRTPALMPGYLNLPAKTAEVMTADGYYVTGDVMRRDADGFHYFVGRADDMFVCGGENIYPGEVEKMLERHPGIHQAAVIPVPDELKGQKPIAFIVKAAGAELDEQAVKSFALANAPAYQHPRRVLFVNEMPLAGTNKIDKRALARQIPSGGEIQE